MDRGSLQVQKERDTVGILLHVGGSVSNLTECNSEHLFDMLAMIITVKRVLGKGFTQIKVSKSITIKVATAIICVLRFFKRKATLPEVLTSTPTPQEPCK